MAPGWLSLALACPVSSADAGGHAGLPVGGHIDRMQTDLPVHLKLNVCKPSWFCMYIEFIYNVHFIDDICVFQWLGWDTGCGHRKLRED
jgi:hypothetical protein